MAAEFPPPLGISNSSKNSLIPNYVLAGYEIFKEEFGTLMAPYWTPINVRYFAFGVFCVLHFWNEYVTYRQYRVYVKNEFIPAEVCNLMDQRTFVKARAYRIDLSRFNFVRSFYSGIGYFLVLYYDGLSWFWEFCRGLIKAAGYDSEDEIIHTAVVVSLCLTLGIIEGLPWSIYSTFVIEQKHGFNKQTPRFFVIDNIKKLILFQVLLVPLVCGAVHIVNIGGDFFFVYLWMFVFAVSIILATVYPDYIAPLFDNYTPLPEGKLRTDIENLAASLKFPLTKIYIVEGSKRSAHSNAYFYGMFKNKRIVLFDTLVKSYNPIDAKPMPTVEGDKTESDDENEDITHADGNSGEHLLTDKDQHKGCSDDEVLAVLCHELGHWKMSHTLKGFVLGNINIFLTFMIFASLYRNKTMYEAFGFFNEMPVLVGLQFFGQISAPFDTIMGYLMTVLSRHFEFQADEFARKMHRASYLRQALITLNKDNLNIPLNDWLFSMLKHSHPPLRERIEALGKND